MVFTIRSMVYKEFSIRTTIYNLDPNRTKFTSSCLPITSTAHLTTKP
jgi:hypothetical protein